MTRYTIAWIAVFIFAGRSVEAQIPYGGRNASCPALFPSSCRALVCVLSGQVLERLRGMFLFIPQADGGGDGGGDGGDGGGGDGTGGDGTGAGDETGDSGDGGDGDGPSGETSTVGAPGDQGDPGNNDDAAPSDPTTDPAAENAALSPTAPSASADVSENSPDFGPRAGGNAAETSRNVLEGLVLRQPPGGPVPGGQGSDVGINAVIVSGAPNPW
jgi:hypothetical protein